jgi:multicomponent Na+:H+ antiporter subunit D
VVDAEGTTDGLPLLGLSLEPVRVDSLARVFATAFCLAALLAVIYGLSVRDRVQQIAILVYAGSAIGGSLAGDPGDLSVFWGS